MPHWSCWTVKRREAKAAAARAIYGRCIAMRVPEQCRRCLTERGRYRNPAFVARVLLLEFVPAAVDTRRAQP